jgi:transcriptional regulator of NAD metabolism
LEQGFIDRTKKKKEDICEKLEKKNNELHAVPDQVIDVVFECTSRQALENAKMERRQ